MFNSKQIGAGTIGTARLGSGTANATSVLYGDNTWKVPSGSPFTTYGGDTIYDNRVASGKFYETGSVGNNTLIGPSPYTYFQDAGYSIAFGTGLVLAEDKQNLKGTRHNFVWGKVNMYNTYAASYGYFERNISMSQNAYFYSSGYNKYNAVIGGEGHFMYSSSGPLYRSALIGGNANTLNGTLDSAILGGINNEISGSSINNAAIIGGSGNTVNHDNSAIIGGVAITSNATNTIFMPKIAIGLGTSGAISAAVPEFAIGHTASSGAVTVHTPIHVYTVTLTKANIEALFTTPRGLGSAPPSGSVVEILSLSARLRYGTATWATITDIDVRYTVGSVNIASIPTGVINATADIINDIPLIASVDRPPDSAISVRANANGTVGDSTLQITMTYIFT